LFTSSLLSKLQTLAASATLHPKYCPSSAIVINSKYHYLSSAFAVVANATGHLFPLDSIANSSLKSIHIKCFGSTTNALNSEHQLDVTSISNECLVNSIAIIVAIATVITKVVIVVVDSAANPIVTGKPSWIYFLSTDE
jgi:hypothetical protein